MTFLQLMTSQASYNLSLSRTSLFLKVTAPMTVVCCSQTSHTSLNSVTFWEFCLHVACGKHTGHLKLHTSPSVYYALIQNIITGKGGLHSWPPVPEHEHSHILLTLIANCRLSLGSHREHLTFKARRNTTHKAAMIIQKSPKPIAPNPSSNLQPTPIK